jgi:transposase
MREFRVKRGAQAVLANCSISSTRYSSAGYGPMHAEQKRLGAPPTRRRRSTRSATGRRRSKLAVRHGVSSVELPLGYTAWPASLPMRPGRWIGRPTTTPATGPPPVRGAGDRHRQGRGRLPAPHRHQEFLAFLKQVAAAYPRVPLHVVCDNYATHKHAKVEHWLDRHPRIQLHFTPTGCSWLNLVECFFSIITRQAIRRGSFTSVEDLTAAIETYVDGWNERATPFTWTKPADELLAQIQTGRLKQRSYSPLGLPVNADSRHCDLLEQVRRSYGGVWITCKGSLKLGIAKCIAE